MPQFDINPAAGGIQSLGDPSSGAVLIVNKKKRTIKPAGGKPDKASGSTATVSSAPKPDKKNKNKNKNKDKDKPQKEPYNPFTQPFLTPNQIRAEAQRLAALSVPTQQALERQYGSELANVQGLTGALSARLGDVAAQQTAGLAGFGNLYSQLASGAQQAGQTAQAAAGAAPVAAGATPLVAEDLRRQAYSITGYQPAAMATGARLEAQTRGGLTKALADRASRMSEATAKYIRDLQDRELQRAISQETAAQNQARLGLSQQQEEWNQQVDVQRLAQGQARIDLSAQRLAASMLKDAKKAGKDKNKKLQSAKDRILNNAVKWTKPVSTPTGEYNFRFKLENETYEAAGRDANDAWGRLTQSGGIDPGSSWDSYTQGSEIKKSVTPNNEDVIKLLQPILVNAGMKPQRARAWILTNVLNINTAPNGAFLGGVGGG